MIPLLTWVFPDTLIVIAIILVFAVASHLLLRKAISMMTNQMVRKARARAEKDAGGATSAQVRVEQRTATIGSLLRSIVAFVVWIIAILMILSALGIPLTPLLASAGVGGIALAFGAQSLVKDFLSGVFMIMEDQYGVGDLIDVGDVTGTVEEVTLRVTRLRDADGMVWYIRNGEILRVGNVSQGWSTTNVDIPLATGQDTQKAIDVLAGVAESFAADPEWTDVLLNPPSVLGVESISAGQITLRMSVRTAPNQQWAPARALREASVTALAKAGFRAPALPSYDPNI
ncbi:mechanosensitive ion channel family protein [Propionicicella superfundia]|uniref:mechanosensitive ion channel family protein n=1 Tax=Propionicicella superfundia TaxID=348582 RepID=UPI001B7FCEBA|nr:mechanosensitive ion channel family protein [Propionicicella superfundia]